MLLINGVFKSGRVSIIPPPRAYNYLFALAKVESWFTICARGATGERVACPPL
jgi:hypothetical protein